MRLALASAFAIGLLAVPAGAAGPAPATTLTLTTSVAGKALPAAAASGSWKPASCGGTSLDVTGAAPNATQLAVVGTWTSPLFRTTAWDGYTFVMLGYDDLGAVTQAPSRLEGSLDVRRPKGAWHRLFSFAVPLAGKGVLTSRGLSVGGLGLDSVAERLQVRWTVKATLTEVERAHLTFLASAGKAARKCAGS